MALMVNPAEPIAANVSNVKQRGRKNAKQAKVDTGHSESASLLASESAA